MRPVISREFPKHNAELYHSSFVFIIIGTDIGRNESATAKSVFQNIRRGVPRTVLTIP
jgi:hypothetical protein